MNPPANSCFGQNALASYAYLPDQDLHGIPFSGSKALQRYTTGPYSGKIRVDVMQNIMDAGDNQVDAAASQLRSGSLNPPAVYIVAFPGEFTASLEDLHTLANDRMSPSFDSSHPAGLAIMTSSPEEFFPAVQRVREDIIRRATVK
jgi:hypothetical protein